MIDLSKFTPQQVAALKAWWAKQQTQQPANKG